MKTPEAYEIHESDKKIKLILKKNPSNNHCTQELSLSFHETEQNVSSIAAIDSTDFVKLVVNPNKKSTFRFDYACESQA